MKDEKFKVYDLPEEQRFIRGYNCGLIIAKYEKALSKKLLGIESDDQYVKGLMGGVREFEKDKQKARDKLIRSRRTAKRNGGRER